ncbi:60S ribosomal protein L18a protein [Trifolium repens]|nr:60S ribosomal protein L18a protein [Trifolium repens]
MQLNPGLSFVLYHCSKHFKTINQWCRWHWTSSSDNFTGEDPCWPSTFVIGFYLAAIPWYVGAIIVLFSRVDYREKPGYIACLIPAIVATIAIVLGATNVADDW